MMPGKTYLDLCRWVLPRVGYSGEMNTVAGASREHAMVASAVEDADMEIQSMYQDWRFLQAEMDLVVDGKNTPAPPGVASYRTGHWRALDPEGHEFAVVVGHAEPPRSSAPGRPAYVWIRADNSLEVYPDPDGEYTLRVQYRRTPEPMIAADDESLIPDQFRQAIALRALQMLSQFEEAVTMEQYAHRHFLEWMDRLRNDQMPGHQYLGTAENPTPEAVRAV